LNVEILRIMALPNMGDRLFPIELVSSTPAELRKFIRCESNRWGALIRKLGLKAEQYRPQRTSTLILRHPEMRGREAAEPRRTQDRGASFEAFASLGTSG
jgi:hypothetical protein